MSNGSQSNEPLSVRFRRAYSVSCRATPSDTDPVVRGARKELRSLHASMEKKLRDVEEICVASKVVSAIHRQNPQLDAVKSFSCKILPRVRRDVWLLNKELQRLKRK